MQNRWTFIEVSDRSPHLPIIGKFCGFGQFRSCSRAVSTSPLHREHPLGNANANRATSPRNGPLCARGLRATKESDVCNAFMHAPRARIPHNDEARPVRELHKKMPRMPAFRMRAGSNPDFSHAHSRFPIERFVLVHCYTWTPPVSKNIRS